jgi:hypothetical protein
MTVLLLEFLRVQAPMNCSRVNSRLILPLIISHGALNGNYMNSGIFISNWRVSINLILNKNSIFWAPMPNSKKKKNFCNFFMKLNVNGVKIDFASGILISAC